MSFIHFSLLGGLFLIGIPILLHLILKQKPKQLPFPAFRFLKQRQLINRRRLRLQQILLLALRMVLIALMVLAMSRPQVLGEYVPRWLREWVGQGNDQAIGAVLIFDTSHSMEYRVQTQGRLEEARRLALDLIRDLPENSRVAILETGDDEPDEDWIITPAQIRARINGLRLRPVAVPLVKQIARAGQLLQKLGQEQQPPTPFLYVFSDRTRISWDDKLAGQLQLPTGLNTVFVDLGQDQPRDAGIERVEVEPLIAAPGARVQVRVTLNAQGSPYQDWVSCQLEGERDAVPARQKVKVAPGKSEEVVFTLAAPQRTGATAPGEVFQVPAQVIVKLITDDNRGYVDELPFNNIGQATFLVRDDKRRQGRQMLTVVEDRRDARIWLAAFGSLFKARLPDAFQIQVGSPDEVAKMTPAQLDAFRVICLFQLTKPPPTLWAALQRYVENGGGLAIVPAGETLQGKLLDDFNKDGSKLLPATLREIVTVPRTRQGISWAGYTGTHPLLLALQEMVRTSRPDFEQEERKPFVDHYWLVDPVKKEGNPIVNYASEARSPALVERLVGQGRVILFTVTLDGRPWHNYWKDSSFGVVLVHKVAVVLAGDVQNEELNFLCGQLVSVPLPPGTPPRASFKLDGPEADLSESERNVQAPAEDAGPVRSLTLPQAVAPGNYRLLDREDRAVAGFSLSVRPEESLLDRLPAKEIEAALGADTVRTVAADGSLRDTLLGQHPGPMEMLPLLMLFVLAVVSCEPLLANHYFRRQSPAAQPGAEETRK